MANPSIFGLLGYPVRHSLSPLMHNAAFRALHIPAKYELFEVRPEELNSFLYGLNKNKISGLNITVPYKEKVMDFVQLGSESFHLRQVRAVNTIIKNNSSWQGFNTDIPGFQKHLRENFNPLGKKTAILGAGGAARAVVYALANAGAGEISIFDIDKEKNANVCAMIGALFPALKVSCIEKPEDLDIKNKDLLVNCTPVGMKETDPALLRKESLHKKLFVYDLIYNPPETRLLKDAKEIGARTSNGLGMLLYQGALSFWHFTGKEAPLEIMRDALEKGVKKI